MENKQLVENKQANNTPPFLKAEFIISAVEKKQFPTEGLPEIVILGRSNAGKSSLLNKWLGRKNLAKVGGTPGRTRQINFFRVLKDNYSPEFFMADLPGYGYAKAPKAMVKAWEKLIFNYLSSQRNFHFCLIIMDIRRKVATEEVNLVNWLYSLNLEVLIVATKADKLKHNQRAQSLQNIKKDLNLKYNPIAFSSVSGLGREELIKVVGL